MARAIAEVIRAADEQRRREAQARAYVRLLEALRDHLRHPCGPSVQRLRYEATSTTARATR